MHLLVTGGAGFIGSHLVDSLLGDGHQVTALDNFDPFYGRATKERNIAGHRAHAGWRLVEADLRDGDSVRRRLDGDFDVVVHLAAKAGVRLSVLDPVSYQDVNVRGTQTLLELARERGIRHFVFASSSSVYGVNPRMPWTEDDHVLQPISPYASTKVSGELLGHVYSHLYGMRFIALRFFTVYGPRQRPDLAIHRFAREMMAGRPLPVYGDGSSGRDYTFIDDVIGGVRAAIEYRQSDFEVINLGNSKTLSLLQMIRGLEEALGVEARLDFQAEQPGDLHRTCANIDKARRLLAYEPRTSYEAGVRCFVEWLQATGSHALDQHDILQNGGQKSPY
jgi:UDP-glucuronate 4-epimerase